MKVRVRFAPSPTGFLHLGGLRTALFNYLFAAGNGGKLILRVEDTDQSRYVPGSVEYLKESFDWLGIRFNESPFEGGPFVPYIQSERLSLYRGYAQDLVKRDGAYHCFCSKERLQTLRSTVHKGYDGLCRELSSMEVEKRLRMGLPHVIRLKVPISGSTVITDMVYGDVEFKNEDIDDQILLKADGFPTYHLANVVDDHIMEISHILRGEEWLSSTCKHKLLYQALDWTAPAFAHIPLLTTKSGSKLSKRSKDIHVLRYKERGYTPEGLINFVALLGWSPKTEREVFSLQELTELFSLNGISKASAIVDETRLDWLNSIHAKRLFEDKNRMEGFVSELRRELLLRKVFGLSSSEGELLGFTYLSSVINVIKEKTQLIPRIPDEAPYFWIEPQPCVEKIKSLSNSVGALESLIKLIESSDFSKQSLNECFDTFRPVNVRFLLRQCVTGGTGGPDIIETIMILGKERTIARIKKGIVAASS